eukprot:TRINITY_DN5545_c0_g1_i1.p1 TRINITY_DN5545_c0_g1~~TRINITY_DN5545_c0_g1_i1.p1  ORF type:complete len:292 (+),score=45.33 TRINITY_DN5545_c0_g1_i1:221-1096(+)
MAARVRDVQYLASARDAAGELGPSSPQSPAMMMHLPGVGSTATLLSAPSLGGGHGRRVVDLNLSPYRDLTQPPKQFKKSTGQVTVALNDPESTPEDPTHFYWLYGWLEFKMNEGGEEVAYRRAVRQVDRLVEKLHKLDAKGCLLFDIIATRKHIATMVPHKLGCAIYRYVEERYFTEITTAFVGLTDNTARRVARDVFCKNRELSRIKYAFDIVDNVHMFVIYPPGDSRKDHLAAFFLVAGGGGGGGRRAQSPTGLGGTGGTDKSGAKAASGSGGGALPRSARSYGHHGSI